jgi:TetR/AcrR family transcriptional regulator
MRPCLGLETRGASRLPKWSKGAGQPESPDIRNKIIDGAEEVFARYGLRGASTAMIAAKARVSKPHIYYYFENKEELYRAVLARTLALWTRAIPEMDAALDPRRFLSDYIHARLEFSRQHPQLSRIFANEILNGAPILRSHIRDELSTSLKSLTGLVEQWIAAGDIKPVDPTHLLFMIWAMTQSYADAAAQMELLLGKRRLDSADFERAEATVRQLVFGGLGLAPPRRKPAS